MQGIYIAAVVTTILSLGIIGVFLVWKIPKKEKGILLAVVLLEIPMCALAFYFIRFPLDGWLQRLLSSSPGIYRFLTTFYAPITEEPIKLWVLAIPWIFRRIERKNAIRFAVAIGLGFGIGEMWMLAEQFAKDPYIASLHWYQLGGYIQERFMVCVMHGAFTAPVICFLRKKTIILGILCALFLHYLGNFPIYLAGLNFLGLSISTWKIILTVWVQLYFLGMLGLLGYLLLKTHKTEIRREI
ncbi:MAG: PrsW family intramembrane metalloprotease [Candidatus Cloacimonadota bacterium]|nr:MAG: PrsW family intramembrane metalloprotease [Candidatus Cloacimonadota bacterium]